MSAECTKKLTFSEQYKHPLWQKKRLEILELASFTCDNCGDTESQLHIHHKAYIKGRDLWEYDEPELDCLCSDCHKAAHVLKDQLTESMAKTDLLPETMLGLCKSYCSPMWFDKCETGAFEEISGKILGKVLSSKIMVVLENAVIADIVNKDLDELGNSPALDKLMTKLSTIARVL